MQKFRSLSVFRCIKIFTGKKTGNLLILGSGSRLFSAVAILSSLWFGHGVSRYSAHDIIALKKKITRRQSVTPMP